MNTFCATIFIRVPSGPISRAFLDACYDCVFR
jgi:hypothetical protein